MAFCEAFLNAAGPCHTVCARDEIDDQMDILRRLWNGDVVR